MVILAIVLILALTGSPDPAPVNQPPAAAGPTTADLINDLNNDLMAHSSNPVELERIHNEAKKLKASGLARKSAKQAMRLDDSLGWAHREMGHVKFDPSGLPDEDLVVYGTDDWTDLQAAREEGWLSKERVEELTAAKTRFAAHMGRLETDGHYRRVCMWKSNVAKHPVFADYEYTTVERGPYLIFIQKPKTRRKLAELEAKAKQKAAIYGCLYKTFLDRFGDKFGLGSLESKDFKEDRVLKAWIFADRASFVKYHEYIGMPVGDNVGAYFNPVDQWMIIPEGMSDGADSIGKQKMDVNVSFHEGTHQLIHYYSKRLIERAIGEEISWTDSRLDSDAHWFQEGVAEWFGSAVKNGDSWDLFQPNLYRLTHWKRIRKGKLAEWSFEDLLAASDNADLERGGHMGSQYYSQSWAFISFLWNFEDGKYREKFLTYFGLEFQGKSGVGEFKKVFGITEVKGSEMEGEFLAYCDELLAGI